MKTNATTRERVGRVGQQPPVVIPQDILETLKNGLLIRAKREVDLNDRLTPAEAETVRRGEAQLKRGGSKPWRVVRDALPIIFMKFPSPGRGSDLRDPDQVKRHLPIAWFAGTR
jgi:hypothetical protein